MSVSTPQPRSTVLVMLHPDGYVEAFGQRHNDIKIVNMPSMNTVEGEALADDYVELMLPPRHREIYFPGLIRATGNVATITPGMMADRNIMLSMARAADRLKAEVGQ